MVDSHPWSTANKDLEPQVAQACLLFRHTYVFLVSSGQDNPIHLVSQSRTAHVAPVEVKHSPFLKVAVDVATSYRDLAALSHETISVSNSEGLCPLTIASRDPAVSICGLTGL